MSDNGIFIIKSKIGTAEFGVRHKVHIFILIKIYKAGIALILIIKNIIYAQLAYCGGLRSFFQTIFLPKYIS